MAPNDLKPNRLSSSEDEEEEEEASGSDSDEASDTDSGEKPKPEPKKALTAPPPPPPPPQSATKPHPSDLSTSYETEDSGSGSETDSDSDLPPKKSSAVVNSTVKPISSVPMERVGRNLDSKLVKKDGSKTVTSPSPAKSKRPPPAPAPVEKDAKKAKQSTANGDVKKSLASSSQSVNKSPASAPAPAPDLSESETEESESGSDTDTDSDLPPKKSAAADPNVKPISSKPMEPVESKLVKKTGSKTVPTPPLTKSTAKSKPLPASALITCKNVKDGKKGRKNGGADEDSKKQLFQRLWSEDDEIVILEGMIEYKNENGESPIADMGAFHEFIKKSLHVDVSRAQLVDKVRRLKKKYVNNASREKDGKDRSFSKSHEQKGYELSKLIWGGNGNSKSNSNISGMDSKKKNQSQKNGKLKGTAASTSTGTGAGTGSAATLLISNGVDDKDKVMMEVEKTLDISRFVRYGEMSGSLVQSEEIVKAGMELVDGSKRAELEAKWRKLKEQELELYVKRMELLREQALVVLEAVRSSGN